MKIVRREFKHDAAHCAAYWVYCPACKRAHRFLVENGVDPAEVWTFDGDLENPTFEPSLLVDGRWWRDGAWQPDICHSYLRAGFWEFLSDCTHAMAGLKVPMVDFPDNYRV